MGQGASQGKESVLADSGWEGEITARVGRVRSLAILSILGYFGIGTIMEDSKWKIPTLDCV